MKECNNRPKLQRGIKTYFYKNDVEYSNLDDTTRFIEISAELHKGLNLYQSIVQDIEYYKLDCNIIHKTICELIAILRYSNQPSYKDEQNNTVLCLFNNMDLKGCVDLFSNELLQRFFSVKSKNGEIEYCQKFIKPQPFFSLCKAGKISVEECLNKVTHANGWCDVSEDWLRENNPWQSIESLYYGYKLYDPSKTFALQEDLNLINSFNSNKQNREFHYHLEVPAEPWQGNPLTANIIILSLNPGWKEECNKDHALQLPVGPVSEGIFAEKRNSLLFNVHGFMPQDRLFEDFNKLGDNYWEKRLSYIKEAVPEMDSSEFYQKFALVQYCAYTSEKYGGGFKNNAYLPSQLFTKDLIRHIVYHRPDVKFLILRAHDKWKALLDNDVWYAMLPRIISPKPNQYRNQRINRTTLYEHEFDSLVELVKAK